MRFPMPTGSATQKHPVFSDPFPCRDETVADYGNIRHTGEVLQLNEKQKRQAPDDIPSSTVEGKTSRRMHSRPPEEFPLNPKNMEELLAEMLRDNLSDDPNEIARACTKVIQQLPEVKALHMLRAELLGVLPDDSKPEFRSVREDGKASLFLKEHYKQEIEDGLSTNMLKKARPETAEAIRKEIQYNNQRARKDPDIEKMSWQDLMVSHQKAVQNRAQNITTLLGIHPYNLLTHLSPFRPEKNPQK